MTTQTQNEPYTEQDVPLLSRRILYLFFSAAFCDPGMDRVDLLFDENFREDAVAAANWLSGRNFDADLADAERHPSELTLEPAIDALTDRDDLREQNRRMFGHTLSKECPPCAIEYTDRTDVFYRSQRLADISGFYRAFGLEESDQWTDRKDHVSLMSEFMALVIQKEMYAAHAGHDPEKIELCRTAARDFFEEHLLWWLPSFACQLKDVAEEASSYYASLADTLAAFSAAERDYFDLPFPDEIPEPNVTEYDQSDGCGTCSIPGVNAGKPDVKGAENPAPEQSGVDLPDSEE